MTNAGRTLDPLEEAASALMRAASPGLTPDQVRDGLPRMLRRLMAATAVFAAAGIRLELAEELGVEGPPWVEARCGRCGRMSRRVTIVGGEWVDGPIFDPCRCGTPAPPLALLSFN